MGFWYFKKSNSKNSISNGDLISNKSADKITRSSKKLNSKNYSGNEEAKVETPKERYISLEKRQQIIRQRVKISITIMMEYEKKSFAGQ